jgi:hypothetical protein
MSRLIVSLLLFDLVNLARADCDSYSRSLANLIAPTKLATLGTRGANPRIQKAVALLEDARRDVCLVSTVASSAVFYAGYTDALLACATHPRRVHPQSWHCSQARRAGQGGIE